MGILKCKCCNQSDFGVNMIQTIKEPVRILNGKLDKVLGESETTKEIEYCFCNICKKVITNNDLYEHIECPICLRKVDKIVNGKCHQCEEVSKSMETISKEDLILMLMRQQFKLNAITRESKPDVLASKDKASVKSKDKIKEKEKEIPSDLSKVKNNLDDDDDMLNKINDLDMEDLNLDDEIELDETYQNFDDEENGNIF